MRNAITIASREIGSYFNAPLFWVLAGGFMAFMGLIVWLVLMSPNAQADWLPFMQFYGWLMVFIAPLLAMRLLAEEQRSGRLEVLMTAPINDWQLVFGKWLGAFVMYVVLIALTLVFVVIVDRLADPKGIAVGPTFAAYIGILLLGAALLALGVLTSSATDSQVIAGFLGVMLAMVLFFLSIVGRLPAGETAIGAAIAYLGISDHYYNNFGNGVIDTRDIVYFLSVTAGALFLATRLLETRRWR